MGETQCQDIIFDPLLAINVSNSMRLIRNCEMFQWKEIQRSRQVKRGDRIETEYYYDYEQQWLPYWIDTNNFHYKDRGYLNDNRYFLFENTSFYANTVYFGAFYLNKNQIDQCQNQVTVYPGQDVLQTAMTIKKQHQYVRLQDKYIYFSNSQGSQPQLGDFRIQFQRVACGPLSIICKQTGQTFNKWVFSKELGQHLDDSSSSDEENQASNSIDIDSGSQCSCCCCGQGKCCKNFNSQMHEIDWLIEKQYTKKQFFGQKINSESNRTKCQRISGWFMLCISIWMLLSPVYNLLYWFPLVGQFIGTMGSYICGLIGIILGSTLSLIVIAIAWIRYRTKVALGMLLLSCFIIVTIIISKYIN